MPATTILKNPNQSELIATWSIAAIISTELRVMAAPLKIYLSQQDSEQVYGLKLVGLWASPQVYILVYQGRHLKAALKISVAQRQDLLEKILLRLN